MRQPSGFQVPKLLWSLGMLGASQSTLMKRLCLEATSVVCSSTSCVKKEGISSTVLYICLLKIHFYKYLQLYIHPHIIQSIPRSIYLYHLESYRVCLLQFFSLSVVQVLRQLPSLSMAELLRSAWGVAAAERGGHDFWKAIQEAPG